MSAEQKRFGKRLLKAVLALALIGLLLAFTPLSAVGSRLLAVDDLYTLPHYSLAGGSGNWASGSGYSLSGSLSPQDGGAASGGGYVLVGGVLSGAGEGGVRIYLPIARK